MHQSEPSETTAAPHQSPLALLGAWSAAAAASGAWLWAADRVAARAVTPQPVPVSGLASLALLGGHTLVAAGATLLLVVLAALWRATGTVTRTSADRPRGVLAALLAAVAVLGPALALADDLVAGESVSGHEHVALIRWGIVAVAVFGASSAGWLTLAWSTQGRVWRPIAFGISALALAAGAAVADVKVLPGLYPSAHLALYTLCALMAAAGCARLLGPLLSRRRAVAATFAGVGTTATIALVALWFTIGPSHRAAIALASPNARTILRHTAPDTSGEHLRRALENVDTAKGALVSEPALGAVATLTGGRRDWNVVLVVVDAMRADALSLGRRPGGISEPGDTPFLDEWLKRTYRFRHVYTAASNTSRGMPALLESREAPRGARPGGLPIAERFRELGRTPVAAVPHWFLLPVKLSGRSLLNGFWRAAFTPKSKQSVHPTLVERVLTGAPRPLFAWLHVYTMHEPYYDGRPLNGKYTPENYLKALRYTDGLVRDIFAVLERQGLTDDTIVVLTADHGECFGEHRKVGHGSTVFEEDVRVPLAIYIPGTPGGIIEQTVGSVDIVPTLVELLGGTVEPGLAGRSLVPLMADPDHTWDRTYACTSGHRWARGVVNGRSKLLWDKRPDTFFLFDLVADPHEVSSVLGFGAAQERQLYDAWHFEHVDRSGSELEDEETRTLLVDRIGQVDAERPGEALVALLKLARQDASPPVMDAVAALFERSDALPARVLAAHALAVADSRRAGTLLSNHVKSLRNDPAAETAFVDGLRRQRTPRFAPAAASAALRRAAESGDVRRTVAWLGLVRPWSKRFGRWSAALEAAAAVVADDPDGLRWLLQNVATLRATPRNDDRLRALGTIAAAHVTSEDEALAAAAIAAVGQLRYAPAAASLRALATARDSTGSLVQARLAHALARVDGADAIPTIARIGEKRMLALDAVAALRELRDPRALPFLENLHKRHGARVIRGATKRAIKALRKLEKPDTDSAG